MKIIVTRLGRWVVLAGLALLVGCTVDDPGPKRCEIGTNDPELQCVSGYSCNCTPDGCVCEKDQSLSSSLHQPASTEQPVSSSQHQREFLRTLGVLE